MHISHLTLNCLDSGCGPCDSGIKVKHLFEDDLPYLVERGHIGLFRLVLLKEELLLNFVCQSSDLLFNLLFHFFASVNHLWVHRGDLIS